MQPTATRSRPGPRPRLSRDQIVVAAAELVRGADAPPLTMARVADAVGAAPMSLYRHFKDRDELLTATARHVLMAPVELPSTAPWRDRARRWMVTLHDRAVTYPQLAQLVAAGTAPVWLGPAAELAEILEAAGITDDDELSQAVYWIAATTLGHAIVDAAHPSGGSTSSLYAELRHLPDDQAALVARLIPRLVGPMPFDVVVDRTLAAVDSLL